MIAPGYKDFITDDGCCKMFPPRKKLGDRIKALWKKYV